MKKKIWDHKERQVIKVFQRAKKVKPKHFLTAEEMDELNEEIINNLKIKRKEQNIHTSMFGADKNLKPWTKEDRMKDREL